MPKKYLRSSQKIIFAGGHARSTAYSIIQELKERHEDWAIYWAGSREILVGKDILSMEVSMFPEFGVRFLPIVTGRIQRRFTLLTITELFKIPVGFLYAFYYLAKIKPRVLVSMGGFAGFPFVVMAKLFGIPVLVHEQTNTAGRANIFSSKLANIIACSRAHSIKYFDRRKCVVTGNPISREVRKIKPKATLSGNPTILVTGGASGSQKINEAVKGILPDLLLKFNVIHQTGGFQFNEFQNVRKRLPQSFQNKYQVFPTTYPWTWGTYLEKADIVVSRAGANIVSELMYVKIPSILIPIPFAYLDEQSQNANSASAFGISTVLPESKLSGKNLLEVIDKTVSNWKAVVKSTSKKISPDINAHKKVSDLVEKLMSE